MAKKRALILYGFLFACLVAGILLLLLAPNRPLPLAQALVVWRRSA